MTYTPPEDHPFVCRQGEVFRLADQDQSKPYAVFLSTTIRGDIEGEFSSCYHGYGLTLQSVVDRESAALLAGIETEKVAPSPDDDADPLYVLIRDAAGPIVKLSASEFGLAVEHLR